jgi:hypothetical protein
MTTPSPSSPPVKRHMKRMNTCTGTDSRYIVNVIKEHLVQDSTLTPKTMVGGTGKAALAPATKRIKEKVGQTRAKSRSPNPREGEMDNAWLTIRAHITPPPPPSPHAHHHAGSNAPPPPPLGSHGPPQSGSHKILIKITFAFCIRYVAC